MTFSEQLARAVLRRAVYASPHFRWSEFDIDHQRPLHLSDRPAYRHLARTYLEPLRAQFGPVTIISSRRTPRYNREVGGAPRSLHLTTAPRSVAAVDLVAAQGSPRQWARFLEHLNPGGLGVYADHVHVDTRLQRSRW